jgi:hypothetical protein
MYMASGGFRSNSRSQAAFGTIVLDEGGHLNGETSALKRVSASILEIIKRFHRS